MRELPNYVGLTNKRIYYPTANGYERVVAAYNDHDETIILASGEHVPFASKRSSIALTVEVDAPA